MLNNYAINKQFYVMCLITCKVYSNGNTHDHGSKGNGYLTMTTDSLHSSMQAVHFLHHSSSDTLPLPLCAFSWWWTVLKEQWSNSAEEALLGSGLWCFAGWSTGRQTELLQTREATFTQWDQLQSQSTGICLSGVRINHLPWKYVILIIQYSRVYYHA
jgi:hypothetical protein